MIRGSVYLELTDHLTSEDVFRQHVFDGFLNGQLRLAVHEQAVGFRTKTAGGTAVAVVMFFVEFGTGQTDLGSVDDDDKVTGIDVGGEGRLVLSTQDLGDLTGETPEGLAFGIDDPPLPGGSGLSGFGGERSVHGMVPFLQLQRFQMIIIRMMSPSSRLNQQWGRGFYREPQRLSSTVHDHFCQPSARRPSTHGIPSSWLIEASSAGVNGYWSNSALLAQRKA